jgi:hypothetical protein
MMRIAMDEIEFKRAFHNLNTLTENVAHVDARNALRVVAHLIMSLDERITELQMQEDDDE